MFSGAELDVWKSSDLGQTYREETFKIRIPAQTGSKLGASVTFQVLILAVSDGGPADAAGVQAGEFIDAVDGQLVSDLRSITDLDARINKAARQDGKILLTLARWKPIRDSAAFKTTHTTRDVMVTFTGR